jgi:hypothetical protein
MSMPEPGAVGEEVVEQVAPSSGPRRSPSSSTLGPGFPHSVSPTPVDPSRLRHSSSYALAGVERSCLRCGLRQLGDQAWSYDPSGLTSCRRTRGGQPGHERTCSGIAGPPGRHPVQECDDLTGTSGSPPRRRVRTRRRAADHPLSRPRLGGRPLPGVRARRGASSPESGRNRPACVPPPRAPARDDEPSATACLPAPLSEGKTVLSSRSVPRRGAPSAACSPSAASREGGSLLVTSSRG